tara:strand:- start:1333 stop:1461 length:129 start_codon:yes stop_codon:yes gene_type:complete
MYSTKDFAKVNHIIVHNEIQIVADVKNSKGLGKKHLNIISLP